MNSLSGSPFRANGASVSLLPVMQQIKMQEASSAVTYAPDPEFGALMAPALRKVIATPEFKYTLITDQAGFPNREPWPDSADVAVLGNSLLIGPGVGYDGAFTTLLQRKAPGRTTLNFGIPGGGTRHQLRVYRRFVRPLRPKLVVATLWLTWDIDNTMQFDRWLAEESTTHFTTYRMTFGDTHGARSSGQRPMAADAVHSLRNLLGKSYLIRALYLRFQAITARPGIVERVKMPDASTVLLGSRDQRRLAQGFERPVLPGIVEVFFRPLQQLQTEVEGNGGRLVVMLVPSKEELYAADTFPAVLRPWQQAKRELEDRGLPTLDLYPVFREAGRQRAPFFRVDSHLNSFGNQLVADALAQWINEQRDLMSGEN